MWDLGLGDNRLIKYVTHLGQIMSNFVHKWQSYGPEQSTDGQKDGRSGATKYYVSVSLTDKLIN